MTKSTLSPELEKRFEEEFSSGRYGNRIMMRRPDKPYTQQATLKDIKSFLALALKEERAKVIEEVKTKILTFENEKLGPPEAVFHAKIMNLFVRSQIIMLEKLK